jgi:hypothetical protein
VGRGGFGRISIANIVSIHPYLAVLQLPLLVDIQQEEGELVISIIWCPSIIIKKTLQSSEKVWLF